MTKATRITDTLAHDALENLDASGARRTLRSFKGAVERRMQLDGRDVLMFSSGNYLDLAHHPEVAEAAARAAHELGCAAAGSRLINGNLTCHDALERELAEFFGTEAALVFGSGYMLNIGVIPALAGEGDIIFSDALAHASIIDGARLSRAKVEVFAHNNVAALAQALAEHRAAFRRALIVVDGVYSMDGDTAPLNAIVALARQYDAYVLVDDPHGTFTLGASGRGTAELSACLHEVDLVAGTLGKALGSFGAFVACSSIMRELLINTARSFIFSCALAPPQIECARAALKLVVREPWRRTSLQANAERLRQGLRAHGISTAPSSTHIVPIRLPGNQQAMAACERLLSRGFHAQGIRYPSVPQGTERLRVTLMASHTHEEIDALVGALVDVLHAP